MAVQRTQQQGPRVARLAREIADLSPEERRELDRLVQEATGAGLQEDSPGRSHHITELRGLGKEIWEGVDVDEYIKEERASWDS